jgi:hypothetical protein
VPGGGQAVDEGGAVAAAPVGGEHQPVEAAGGQALQGNRRGAAYRLAFDVEGSIDQDRDAGQRREAADDVGEEGVMLWVEGLDAGGAVGVDHGRDGVPAQAGDGDGNGHERAGLGQVEVVGGAVSEDDRRERAERLAELHDVVQPRGHVRHDRGREDRPVPRRPRAGLQPALEQARDFTFGELSRKEPCRLGNLPR